MKPFPILLAALAALPLAAHAQEAQRSIRVPYADLDLSTPTGVKTLDRRLAWAISALCSETPGSIGMAQGFSKHRCEKAKRAEIAPLRERVIAAQAKAVVLASRVQ